MSLFPPASASCPTAGRSNACCNLINPLLPPNSHLEARCVGVASQTQSTLWCSRRWYATAHASSSAGAKAAAATDATSSPSTSTTATTFARLSTATEAAAELQRWLNTLTEHESNNASSVALPVLTGKSLVLCVAALQLGEAQGPQEQQQQDASSSEKRAAGDAPPVQQYLTALARHVYTQCNAHGKPRAAWALFDDVEKSVIRAEALHTSLHYLQHHAFGSVTMPGSSSSSTAEEPKLQRATQAPTEYEARCAARDLELTFEAVEVLLAGRQIAEIHREAALVEEVGSPSTTAAMVPPAEAAAFYIGTVVRLTHDPLPGCEGDAARLPANASPFLSLPPAKQQFWTQSAQQLTTVLYLALLITNTNTTDAQLVNQVFRDAVRKVYGVPTDRFGVVRAMHYMVTVALPYVTRSFATLMDVVRAQQAQAAKEATAAAKANAQRTSGETKLTNASSASAAGAAAKKKKGSPSFSQQGDHTSGGKSSSKGNEGPGEGSLSSDRMNKITLVFVCVAAIVYLASANREKLFPAAISSRANADDASRDKDLQHTYQKLSAMAASATALQNKDNEDSKLLADAMQKK